MNAADLNGMGKKKIVTDQNNLFIPAEFLERLTAAEKRLEELTAHNARHCQGCDTDRIRRVQQEANAEFEARQKEIRDQKMQQVKDFAKANPYLKVVPAPDNSAGLVRATIIGEMRFEMGQPRFFQIQKWQEILADNPALQASVEDGTLIATDLTEAENIEFATQECRRRGLI